MNKIRELVISLPKLAGVRDHEQWSWIAGKIFDADANKETDLFDRSDKWSIPDRLRFLFPWVHENHTIDIANHGMALIYFAAKSIDINNDLCDSGEGYIANENVLSRDEKNFPEIAAILTVAEAKALLGWVPVEAVV